MTIQAAQFYSTCTTPESDMGEIVSVAELNQIYELGVSEGLIQTDETGNITNVDSEFLMLTTQIANDYQFNHVMFEQQFPVPNGPLNSIIDYGIDQCGQHHENAETTWHTIETLGSIGLMLFGLATIEINFPLGLAALGIGFVLGLIAAYETDIPSYCYGIESL